MIRLSLGLVGLAICNAILAVLMPWYVVTHLGVGIETDSFFAAGALPQLIFLVVSSALTQILVPLLATEDEKTFRRDAWGIFIIVSVLASLLALILSITAGFWVPRMVLGFSDKAKLLTISLTRIQMLAMIGNASVAVLWSAYYARQRFFWAELSSILANIISLLFIFWLLPVYGIVAAAWATVLNLGLKVALLMPALGRWQRPQWNSYVIKETWRRVKPFLFGQTYSRTDPLIDRFLISMTIAGYVSLLYIGQQIYSTINLIITKAIALPTAPKLAIAAKAGNWPLFRRIYRYRLWWMMGLSVLAGIILLVFGERLLHLMIGHGGITAQNVRLLWWIMLALIGLFVGGSAGQLTAVAFYAMGDTRTPTNLFIWTYTIYIPIKVIAFFSYGLMGVAVATSVHLVLNFVLQLIVLERATSPGRVALRVG